MITRNSIHNIEFSIVFTHNLQLFVVNQIYIYCSCSPMEVFNEQLQTTLVIVLAYLLFLNKYTCCANKWSDFIELIVISLNSDQFALIPVNFDQL